MNNLHRIKSNLLLFFGIVFFSLNCTKLPEPNQGLNNRVSFTVKEAELVTFSSARLSATISCPIDNLVGKERGFCVSLTNNTPTINDTKIVSGSGIGSYVANISSFLPVRKYFFRPYIILGASTNVLYGEVKSFTTLSAPPSLVTSEASNISYTTANCGGSISSDGGVSITQRGICWSTSSAPTTSSSKNQEGSGIGSFTSSITGLSPNTTYFVRAYAINTTGTFYGNEVTFKTTPLSAATITTTSVTNITTSSAISGGNVSLDGGSAVTHRGVCWSTSKMPTILNSRTTDGSGLGNFSSTINGLISGTTYYVRAYATNSVGTSYGTELNFNTAELHPVVSSGIISSITGTSATYSGGSASVSGGSSITDKGVCWSTNSNPTVSNSHVSLGAGSGSISASLTSLIPGVTYYVRAYATNSTGTSYSNQINFTTDNSPPVVSSGSISSITGTSATYSGGSASVSGGSSITDKGVCWSTNSNPTVSNSHVSLGAGSGSISASLSSLSPGVTYYVRAYATNSAGTTYSSQVNFTTANIAPVVSSGSISSITGTSATYSGGSASVSGGTSITDRGVCWSTNSNPTIANSRVSMGAGSGSISASLSSLSPGVTYHVRAYATNSAGTTYSNQVNFTTADIAPVVSSGSISSITSKSATYSGGSASVSGGSSITDRGVCWSTNSNPTIANSRVSMGAGSGSISASLSSLSPGVTYYVRAYATNSAGTTYSSQVSFTTADCESAPPTLILPAGGSTPGCCYLNFSWSKVCGATLYQIQISRSSTFSNITISAPPCGGASSPNLTYTNTTITSGTTFCMNTGTSGSNGIWYWRVRATNGSNTSWSEVRWYNYKY
jgi:hypothetical protein